MAFLHEDAQVVGDSDDKVYCFNLTTPTFMKREKPVAERATCRMTGNLSKTPNHPRRDLMDWWSHPRGSWVHRPTKLGAQNVRQGKICYDPWRSRTPQRHDGCENIGRDFYHRLGVQRLNGVLHGGDTSHILRMRILLANLPPLLIYSDLVTINRAWICLWIPALERTTGPLFHSNESVWSILDEHLLSYTLVGGPFMSAFLRIQNYKALAWSQSVVDEGQRLVHHKVCIHKVFDSMDSVR